MDSGLPDSWSQNLTWSMHNSNVIIKPPFLGFGDFKKNKISHQQFLPCIDNINCWIKGLEENQSH